MKQDVAYWESVYNNRAAVPEHADIFARWARSSAAARERLRGYLDVPYGAHRMETVDVFRAEGRSRALLAFIHGGYWRSLDKSDFSFIAAPFVKAGVTVAVPNYALCPEVSIEEIVRQTLQCCAWLHRNGANFGAPAGSLYLAGHSAGGHLVAMMMAALWPVFSPDLPRKVVQGGLAVSGVYDLRDLPRVPSLNADLRLDAAQAAKVSPILLPPATDAPLHLAAGGKELPPFVAQNRALGARWKPVLAEDLPFPDDNHFTILDHLGEPSGALFASAMRMMRLA